MLHQSRKTKSLRRNQRGAVVQDKDISQPLAWPSLPIGRDSARGAWEDEGVWRSLGPALQGQAGE